MRPLAFCLAAIALAGAAGPARSVGVDIEIARVPNGGMQPEIAVERAGTLHMVYLTGEPSAADVFYVRSTDGGRTFSTPVRVNSQPASATATGTIRGAQIAFGRGGRAHVAWNGSATAVPKPPADPKIGHAGMPMLYARSSPDGTSFEPQRNLMTRTTHLDGGGSVAADARGGVYVAWHANALGEDGEAARRVWIARSDDEGATFGRERAVSDPATGVCGCCALRLSAVPAGALHLLYRSARETVHRDVHALTSTDEGTTFNAERLHGWEIGACPMTSMAIVPRTPALHAWETEGQVYFGEAGRREPPIAPPLAEGESPRRKHPRLAVNAEGIVLLVWADATAWNRGGSVAWQAFTPDARAAAIRGVRPGIPPWSFAAVAAKPDGGFVVLY
jgi:hypothetical protein